MKKQITSVSKRKWIVGGFLFFGGIALLTTGFATWIIGTQIMTSGGDLSVGVDTAMNQSISISCELSDDSLYLRENVVNDTTNPDQIVSTDNTEDADFTIKFSKIEIQCGVEFYQENYCTFDPATGVYTPKAFELTVDFDKDGSYFAGLTDTQKANLEDLTSNISISSSAISTDLLKYRLKDSSDNYLSSYNYIEVVTDKISISETEAINGWEDHFGGFKQIVIAEKEFHFKWGNYFSYKNGLGEVVNEGPCAFYNNISKIEGSSWRTLAHLQLVEDEINAMNAAFTASDSTKTGVLAIEVSLPEIS